MKPMFPVVATVLVLLLPTPRSRDMLQLVGQLQKRETVMGWIRKRFLLVTRDVLMVFTTRWIAERHQEFATMSREVMTGIIISFVNFEV